VVAAAPWIAAAFVPPGSQRELTTVFATLLLPEIFFYGLGAMFMAILNIKHVYRPGAWSPVLNNVVVMLTVLLFWALPGPKSLDPSSMTNTQILVIGIGTTLGIAAQALVLVPALRRSGFTWQWRFRARPGETDRLREIGTLAGWVLGYVVVSQVGVSVIQRIGNENGGFSVFTYADLLFQMPYGILVVSVLTAIMPRLSRAAVREDTKAVKDDLSFGARLSAVALVPITAGLIVLGPAMGVTLFGYGQASIADAHLIGSALAWSAFGLLPFALVMLQLRVFYAMRDGRTPTLINGFMVGTKVALVLVTNEVFKAPAGTDVNEHPSVHAVQWLNISTSFSYVVGAVVGHVLLTRRLGRLGFRGVAGTVTRISIASAVAAFTAWLVLVGARHSLGAGHAGYAVGLVGGGLVGLAVLAAVLWRMRVDDVRQVLALARRR
jgi:putative peptidoglycan lipid II flippase